MNWIVIGNIEQIKNYVRATGFDLKNQELDGYDGRCAIHIAATGLHVEMIKYLVEDVGCDAEKVIYDTCDKYHKSPLCYAIECGKYQICEYLIKEKKVNIHKPVRGDNYYPIHVAMERSSAILQLLLECGANPDVKLKRNINYSIAPLSFAVELCHAEEVNMLLEHGASPFIGDLSLQEQPLIKAAVYKRWDIVKMISDAMYHRAQIRCPHTS